MIANAQSLSVQGTQVPDGPIKALYAKMMRLGTGWLGSTSGERVALRGYVYTAPWWEWVRSTNFVDKFARCQ